MWGPDFPHSSSSWPVDYELGLEILERAGATRERDRADHVANAADIYKLPVTNARDRRRPRRETREP